ncbi:hypothetical protein phiKDA1_9 (endogenous virus) [Enterobacter phage phiKDA1]|uniref:Uncharacterized protein n=1 Tax=Enterobacter phage phiKDA1 TaxID=1147139 RepID=A0A0A6Z5B1_9CAUD|nr:hypothetical protein HOQ86_gp10 [Enterobacter phage phiKDA1]AFE86102.1 hypothetical protein phiKDA1_9 [Enterobacter phage phiKDA1]
MTALEAAIKLREYGPSRCFSGICRNLHHLDADAYALFDVYLRVCSYNSTYPVEVNLMGMCPDYAEAYYASCGDKWVGAHGVARMQLLNDFINWLEPKK